MRFRISKAGAAFCILFALLVGGIAAAASGDIATWANRAGTTFWRMTSAGVLAPGSNATYDIGTTALQVRNVKCVNLTASGTYAADDLGATDDLTVGDDATVGDVLNVTGLTTLNNTTVNATKTASLLGPVCLGTISVTGNTTVTATCATVIRITSLSGNISVNITSPPAGKVMTIVDESGTVGINGNVTVNVTGGTINGVDNITLTNTSTVGGKFDPTTGTNITSWKAFFPSTTTGFIYR